MNHTRGFALRSVLAGITLVISAGLVSGSMSAEGPSDAGVSRAGSAGVSGVSAGPVATVPRSPRTVVRRPTDSPEGISTTRSRTYTLREDFLDGTLVNLNLGLGDELRLDSEITAPFPFFNVPARSRGTLIRIDTRAGEVIGEYRCFPQGISRAGYYGVCRTAVDSEGAVWVCDRNNGTSQPATIVKIGVVVGGTRVAKLADGTVVPDEEGGYLQPPFDFVSTGVVDRDGDGLIRTSRGLGDMLDWENVTDAEGGGPTRMDPALVEDAEDELIIVYQLTTGTNEWAAIAVDGNDDLYAAAMNQRQGNRLWLLDGPTGALLADLGNPGNGGYSGIIDQQGVFWSGTGYTSAGVRYDTLTDTATNIGNYSGRASSWAQAPDGRVWCVSINGVLYEHEQATGSILRSFPSSGSNNRSIAFSGPSDLWTGLTSQSRVARLDPATGAVKASVPVGSAPTNVGVDADGFVWTSTQGSNTAERIDPATDTVDMVIDLGPGAGPYNYNDGTGQVTAQLNQEGFWRVVHDGCLAGTVWNDVSWSADVPMQTGLRFEARAAESVIGLSSEAYIDITNGEDLAGALVGRFIEIRAVFSRDEGAAADATPVLFDMTVNAVALPQLAIDIMPNREPNPIMMSRDYTIYVGVMNRADELDGFRFVDPTTVAWDLEGVSFGRLGMPAAGLSGQSRLIDLDGDGDLDALLGFRTFSAGFMMGDVIGELRLERTCEPAIGTDSVVVVN